MTIINEPLIAIVQIMYPYYFSDFKLFTFTYMILMMEITHSKRNGTFVPSDPLPPTDLTVSAITTSSLKIHWQYDSSTSFCVKWKIKYTDKDNEISEIITNSTNVTDLTIDHLYAGMTYTIDVFGVTINEVVGEIPAKVEKTVSKYVCHIADVYLPVS